MLCKLQQRVKKYLNKWQSTLLSLWIPFTYACVCMYTINSIKNTKKAWCE